jgi:hypothetical protein
VKALTLIVTALLALAGCRAQDSIRDRQYGQVLVCHDGETKAVSTADYLNHQQHGDSTGPCPDGG